MSKNIFDEALESFTDIETDVVDVLEMQNYDWWVIKRSLELGQLYKELSNYIDEQTYAHKLPEITQLKIKIKELENE